MRLTTANLFGFNKPPVNEKRQRDQVEFIRDKICPDILCVQEFWHATADPDDPALAAAFADFREQLGRALPVSTSQPASARSLTSISTGR
jgi:hypothetical protein